MQDPNDGPFPEVGCPEPVEGLLWVYILLCENGSFYVGQTCNVAERLRKHRYRIASKHTSDNGLVRLVYLEEHENLNSAIRRESQLKRWSRAKKEALVCGDIQTLKKLSQSHSD